MSKIDSAVRLVVAYFNNEFDDLDILTKKVSFLYDVESSIRINARRLKDDDPEKKVWHYRASLLGMIITRLEKLIR